MKIDMVLTCGCFRLFEGREPCESSGSGGRYCDGNGCFLTSFCNELTDFYIYFLSFVRNWFGLVIIYFRGAFGAGTREKML